ALTGHSCNRSRKRSSSQDRYSSGTFPQSFPKESTMSLGNLDLRGLNPAPVTPFTVDGDVDYAALAGLGKFLASVDGVKSLVVLGHAGEGTFLTPDEQVKVIETLVNEVGDQVAIVA